MQPVERREQNTDTCEHAHSSRSFTRARRRSSEASSDFPDLPSSSPGIIPAKCKFNILLPDGALCSVPPLLYPGPQVPSFHFFPIFDPPIPPRHEAHFLLLSAAQTLYTALFFFLAAHPSMSIFPLSRSACLLLVNSFSPSSSLTFLVNNPRQETPCALNLNKTVHFLQLPVALRLCYYVSSVRCPFPYQHLFSLNILFLGFFSNLQQSSALPYNFDIFFYPPPFFFISPHISFLRQPFRPPLSSCCRVKKPL